MMYIVYEETKDEKVLYGIYTDRNDTVNRAKFCWNKIYPPYTYIVMDDCIFGSKICKSIYFVKVSGGMDFIL